MNKVCDPAPPKACRAANARSVEGTVRGNPTPAGSLRSEFSAAFVFPLSDVVSLRHLSDFFFKQVSKLVVGPLIQHGSAFCKLEVHHYFETPNMEKI